MEKILSFVFNFIIIEFVLLSFPSLIMIGQINVELFNKMEENKDYTLRMET